MMQESDWVRPWGHWQRKCVVIIQMMQQPIPSYNDYRGITCLILMLLKKMISIYKRMASEALFGRITHGKTQKQNESLNSIHKLNSIRNDLSNY